MGEICRSVKHAMQQQASFLLGQRYAICCPLGRIGGWQTASVRCQTKLSYKATCAMIPTALPPLYLATYPTYVLPILKRSGLFQVFLEAPDECT